jgi:ribonuclease HII
MRDPQYIIGCDEAGRGAWAGPIVAAALLSTDDTLPSEVRDSKELKEKTREKLFTYLTNNYAYGIGVVSPQMIDTFGISYANALAFERALRHLRTKGSTPPNAKIKIDGRNLPIQILWCRDIKFYEKGESKYRTIAGASIIAKTFRDALMKQRAEREKDWGWELHKGYGTKLHQETLKKYRPIIGFHRMSYKPIKDCINKL